ncbi:MAG: YcbK family protein [Candidatus Binatia bacterium]
MRYWLAVSLLLLTLSSLQAGEANPRDRYFFSGDGWIQLTNTKTNKSARIRYRLPDGSYPQEAHQQIDRLFGVPAASDDSMSLRLISLLDYVEDRFHQPIKIISGYRSPEYNEGLRSKGRLAAKTSLHTEGMAIDFLIQKARAAKAFKIIRDLQCCGIGYYHGNSLHLDTGPPRFWDETSSKVRTDISSHNKRVMVRTDQDIYRPGEKVELRLARITDYPLGLASGFSVIRNGQTLQEFSFNDKSEACLPVTDPKERTMMWTIPPDFQPQGKVQIRLRFCDKPFPEMPDQLESNPLLILSPRPIGR